MNRSTYVKWGHAGLMAIAEFQLVAEYDGWCRGGDCSMLFYPLMCSAKRRRLIQIQEHTVMYPIDSIKVCYVALFEFRPPAPQGLG